MFALKIFILQRIFCLVLVWGRENVGLRLNVVFQKLGIIAGRLDIWAVAFIRCCIWCKENLTLEYTDKGRKQWGNISIANKTMLE